MEMRVVGTGLDEDEDEDKDEDEEAWTKMGVISADEGIRGFGWGRENKRKRYDNNKGSAGTVKLRRRQSV